MEFEGCETWSFVNADMFPPPVNTLSVVIGACRVISEYSHFLAKLQAPANMLRAYIANIFVNYKCIIISYHLT
jgi:energy-converting hydrogenase Eha subunit A